MISKEQRKIIATGQTIVCGRVFDYDVVNHEAHESLAARWFACCDNGRPFISDEIPPQFRGPMAFHEIYERQMFPNKPRGYCRDTLVEELKTVAAKDLPNYVRFRLGTFRELKGFYELHFSGHPFIAELELSMSHLEDLAAT